MHERQPIPESLRRLAAAQEGLLSAEQAGLLGFGNSSVRRLIAQGHWSRTDRGIYDLRPGTDSLSKSIWEAALRAGEPCAVGGEAALLLHGLDRRVNDVIVWTPDDRRPRSDPRVRMRRDSIGRLERRRGLLPRIRAEDAVIDVAERLRTEEAVGLISEAVRLHRVSLATLRSGVAERARVRNRRLLTSLLDDLDGIESTLEFVYRRDVERAHGLPKARRQHSRSAGTRTDVDYDPYRVLVELDGRAGHQDSTSVFRDLHRDNAHATRELITLRYGSADVRGQPCLVARQVAVVLRLHGWGGTLSPCPSCRSRFLAGE